MTTTAAATSTYLDAGYLTRSTRATSTDAGSSIDAGYLDAGRQRASCSALEHGGASAYLDEESRRDATRATSTGRYLITVRATRATSIDAGYLRSAWLLPRYPIQTASSCPRKPPRPPT